ncbi:hypothetical protein [Streptomyces lydicus]|uniref:hypothetical protein n=1 Tax=Streptomyces lydicus TaxID=47763 RepID=UPI001F51263D|nr:hypothetical protein [Streptomyces lydicus]
MRKRGGGHQRGQRPVAAGVGQVPRGERAQAGGPREPGVRLGVGDDQVEGRPVVVGGLDVDAQRYRVHDARHLADRPPQLLGERFAGRDPGLGADRGQRRTVPCRGDPGQHRAAEGRRGQRHHQGQQRQSGGARGAARAGQRQKTGRPGGAGDRPVRRIPCPGRKLGLHL